MRLALALAACRYVAERDGVTPDLNGSHTLSLTTSAQGLTAITLTIHPPKATP